MERSFVHQVHNNVNADPMNAMLVLEKGNNTNIVETNMFLYNTLTRDLQCFNCFEIYERSFTTSSSTLYLKNMSFFSIHFFLSFCNPFIQFFFIYLFSLINVTKINVNYVSISFSLTIHSGAEDLDGNKRTTKKQSYDKSLKITILPFE